MECGKRLNPSEAVYHFKRAGRWVRTQLISLMSQPPAAGDGVVPVRCGPSQPIRRRMVGKREAGAYASTSHGMASSSSADAEAYASASTGHASSPSSAEACVSASIGQAPDAPTTVLKRPAACRKRQAPVQYEAVSAIPPPPPPWSQPAPTSLPKWAPHALRVLMERGHLSSRVGQQKRLELTVWSDCSGINSEMFALRELGNELRVGLGVHVTWILYMTCGCLFDPLLGWLANGSWFVCCGVWLFAAASWLIC